MPGIVMAVQPFQRTAFNAPAANTQATVSTIAPATAKGYQVIKGIEAVLCGDTAGASGPVQMTLRDGGAGGTIIRSWFLVAPANTTAILALPDLHIRIPTAGNGATLQFEAAGGGTTSRETVALAYYNSDEIEEPAAFGRLA